MNTEQTKGQWQSDELSILLDCIERYSGTTSLLIEEASKKTGRSHQSIHRKLVKMGYLSRIRNGYTTYSKAVGHIK